MPRLESPAIDAVVARVRATLSDSHPQIAEIFEGCFRNSLDTSVTLEPDGTTFVATGDIPAMWLRDSAAQVRPYVRSGGRGRGDPRHGEGPDPSAPRGT